MSGGFLTPQGSGDDCCCGGVTQCYCPEIATTDCGVSWNCPFATQVRIIDSDGATVFVGGGIGSVHLLPNGLYTLQCYSTSWASLKSFTIACEETECCAITGTEGFNILVDFNGRVPCVITSTSLDVFNGTYNAAYSGIVPSGIGFAPYVGMCYFTAVSSSQDIIVDGVTYTAKIRLDVFVGEQPSPFASGEKLLVELRLIWDSVVPAGTCIGATSVAFSLIDLFAVECVEGCAWGYMASCAGTPTVATIIVEDL
jgi:hypothetical protein